MSKPKYVPTKAGRKVETAKCLIHPATTFNLILLNLIGVI